MTRNPISTTVLLCLITGLCSSQLVAQLKKSESKPAATVSEAPEQIRLKLNDGSYLVVDDAWETAQGIWYRQGSISHLTSKDRVKAIEKHARAQVATAAPSEAPQFVTRAPAASGTYEKPAWIYLKGGARVEADSAQESTAGVWYIRGPLTIFIEHSRVDHIELEDAEKIAESTGPRERGWSTGSAKLDSLIRQNGGRYGVDPYLIFLVMEQESHFNTRVVSPKGARGLMQLMPGTSARFGVRSPNDPAQNISGGTRYLRQLLDRFDYRVDLVLASYNAGEGAVIKFGHKVPPYRETRNYVNRISYRYQRKTSRPRAQTPADGVVAIGER